MTSWELIFQDGTDLFPSLPIARQIWGVLLSKLPIKSTSPLNLLKLRNTLLQMNRWSHDSTWMLHYIYKGSWTPQSEIKKNLSGRRRLTGWYHHWGIQDLYWAEWKLSYCNWSVSQKVKISVFSEQVALRLSRIKFLSSHDEMAGKVTPYTYTTKMYNQMWNNTHKSFCTYFRSQFLKSSTWYR